MSAVDRGLQAASEVTFLSFVSSKSSSQSHSNVGLGQSRWAIVDVYAAASGQRVPHSGWWGAIPSIVRDSKLKCPFAYLDAHLVVPGRFKASRATAGTSRSANFSSPSAARIDTRTSGPSRAYRPSASSAASNNASLRTASNARQQQQPPTPTRRRRRPSTRFRQFDEFGPGANGPTRDQGQPNERTWLLRPSRDRVESWLDAWWKRWLILVFVPSVIVWTWCAIPFPVSDPYDPKLPWPEPGWNWTHAIHLSSSQGAESAGTTSASLFFPTSVVENSTSDGFTSSSSASRPDQALPREVASQTGSLPVAQLRQTHPVRSSNTTHPKLPDDLPVDVNFWFFLVVYYGAYLAVALIWVTCLFNLYRLNWWPRKLGGRISYFCFWSGGLVVGTLVHHFDIFGIQRHRRSKGGNGRTHTGDPVDWERKSFWVSLAFMTTAMPALVCFAKLRRDRRMTYRHSLTEHQRTFLERQLGRRIPKSYTRFLWFLACIAIAIVSGLAGQAYMSVYLSTLPHGSVESVVYVWTWVISCGLFGNLAGWILEKKVGSQALDFVFRLYFQLVYHVFYRTLFARLRKAEQFLYIQALSSIWIITFYPVWMSRSAHRLLKWLTGAERSYADHADYVASNLYIRNLSENVTMVAFLGWLTILHFGPNREVYPFFDFSEKDPYNYRRTAISSLIIWFFELMSSFIARLICNISFQVDVTNTGLDTLRDYPELLPACVWASVHVCMDILLFLVTYNFR